MLHVKALYNLLRITEAQEPGQGHPAWAVEDLRELPLEILWDRLRKAGLFLERETLGQYVEECDTPEQLAELLLPDDKEPGWLDQHYLLLFELWRRLFPEKQSLSLFCDELDHRIALYDAGVLEHDETIQDGLANLLEILEENSDAGADPQEVFQAVCQYCAHDLELFLFDRISDILDEENFAYASELLEGFHPFVLDQTGFSFLRIRWLSHIDPRESDVLLAGLLKKELPLPLLLEMLRFLSSSGDRNLFVTASLKAIPLLETEEEMQELLGYAVEYYQRLDQEEAQQAVQTLLSEEKDPGSELSQEDQRRSALMALLTEPKRVGSGDSHTT